MTTASKRQRQHRTHPKHHRHHKTILILNKHLTPKPKMHSTLTSSIQALYLPPNGAVTDSELTKGPTVGGMMSSLKQRKKHISINDFNMMCVLGKGCAGKVCNFLISLLTKRV